MEGSNLLSEGIDTLNEIKENLLELRGCQANNASLRDEEEKLEKSINNMERSIAEEIQATTRKRRDEIEDTFDKQVDKTRAQMKKIKEKRDKRKNLKVSERIAGETADLRAENNSHSLEAKTLLKQRQIPAFCNTKLYYSLYAPSCFTDILVILAVIAIILFILPCGIYYYLLPGKAVYLILTYIITVLLFGGLYLLIGHQTKEKNLNEIHKVKDIRAAIRENKKKIAVIKKNIRKDKDESAYGLQKFDEELAKLEQEVTDISQKKKEALEIFDNSTKQMITAEIQGLNESKLNSFKSDYETVCDKANKAEERMKALTIKIASEYEPFVGKDLMTLERLDVLITILQAGSAATISEAITLYRQNQKAD